MTEFCQLQKLLEWKLRSLESFSLSSKLFIASFLTSFILIRTLSGQIWKNNVKSKNHQIYEFGKLWRIPVGEQYKIWSLHKLFKIPFLTTFISNKRLYDQIWNICQIYQIFCFLICISLATPGGERCILKGWSWIWMLFKLTFLTTFIWIIWLYDQIWQNYFIFVIPN